MKRIVFIVALAAGMPAFAQSKPPASPEATKPETKAPAKPMARKHGPKRGEDARHCLEKPSNTEIIKCSEDYL